MNLIKSTLSLPQSFEDSELVTQISELIQIRSEISELLGIEFLYRDFRVGFREGQEKARELGLYMQKYCGCIFSEEDRYKKQILRDLENASF